MGTVEFDLRKYETEQYDLDTKFDPADLSEVTQEEVNAAWDDMPMKRYSALMTAIKKEDWDQFAIDFREMLIESRTF